MAKPGQFHAKCSYQWKRSADRSKEVPATFGGEALKEVPASEALRGCTSFDYFICNIPVVICKLDLEFCFLSNRKQAVKEKKRNRMFTLTGT